MGIPRQQRNARRTGAKYAKSGGRHIGGKGKGVATGKDEWEDLSSEYA